MAKSLTESQRIQEISATVSVHGRTKEEYWEAIGQILSLVKNANCEEVLPTLFKLMFDAILRLQDVYCVPLLPPDLESDVRREVMEKWVASEDNSLLRRKLHPLVATLGIPCSG